MGINDSDRPTDLPTGERLIFEGRPAALGNLTRWILALLTLGGAWVYFWFRSLNRRYRVTTQRIVVEEGLFSKRLEQVDLYRLNDYVVERTVGQRLFGTGTIIVRAMDRTTPELRMEHLKTDVEQLYERIRSAAESEKQKRLVRVVDNEIQSSP